MAIRLLKLSRPPAHLWISFPTTWIQTMWASLPGTMMAANAHSAFTPSRSTLKQFSSSLSRNSHYLISSYKWLFLVNYPAAELRGIKIQNLFPRRHSCGSRNPFLPSFSGLPLSREWQWFRVSQQPAKPFRLRRPCFHPPSRAERYSTGIFINISILSVNH